MFQGGDLDQPKIKIKTDIFKPDDLAHRQDKPLGMYLCLLHLIMYFNIIIGEFDVLTVLTLYTATSTAFTESHLVLNWAKFVLRVLDNW